MKRKGHGINRSHTLTVLAGLQVASVALLLGCGQPPPMSVENRGQFSFNVAETNAGYAMSAQQLFDFVSMNAYALKGGTLSQSQVSDLLDSILVDTLSGFHASSIKLDQYRLVYRDYLHQYQDYLIGKFTDSAVVSRVSALDSAEVLALYHTNPQRFTVKEQVHLYQILISGYGLQSGPDSAYYKKFSHAQLRDEARDKINTVYQILRYGEPFENVAAVFNQDVRTRDANGLVGWTTAGVYLDPFDSVAFRLKLGEFSKPYLDKDGWHILYVDGRLPEGPLPIDTPWVFEYTRQTLLADKKNARAQLVMDSLRQGLNIESNDAVLDSNIYLVDDETWCGVVNGEDTIRAYMLKYYEEGFRQRHKVESTTREMKHEMLRTVADRFLSLQGMRHTGWDKDTSVVAFEKALRHNKSKQIVLNRQFDFNWMPTEAAVKEYYDQHISDYVFEKPTTLQTMTVGDSAFAVFLHDQAMTGLDLPDIMDQFGATNPGGILKVSPVMKAGPSDLPFEVWRAGVVTAIKSVSAIVKDGGNFVFVKVLDRKESQNLNLARGGIVVTLQKEHQRRLFEQLRADLYKQYDVRFPKRLSAITLQPSWIRNKKPS